MPDVGTIAKALSDENRVRSLAILRKHGRWMYYRLADENVPAVANAAIGWALNALGRDEQREKDTERLLHILTINPFDDPPRPAATAKGPEEALRPYVRVRDEIKAFIAFIEQLPETLLTETGDPHEHHA
jgi:hypothetical protein